MIEIRLDPPEIALASFVGGLRCASAFAKGRPAAHRYNGDPFTISIQGAAAEIALAKHLDKYWTGALAVDGDLSKVAADVGEHSQARSTNRLDGCLILHPEDPDDHEFWLVTTNEAPIYRIAGWIKGRNGKDQRWWRSDGGVRSPAYFVPQHQLNTPERDWVDDYVTADPFMAAEEHPDYEAPF